MKSVFTEAYKYRQTAERNNLEDYLTEIFASLLRKDKLFASKVLDKFGVKIKQDTHILVSTQVVSITRKRPDIQIIIPSQKTIILVENKVESKEGKNQLENYLSILQTKTEYETKILVYLTKYIEFKNINSILENFFTKNEVKSKKVRFYNFKWSHINLLCKNGSILVNEFSLFLNNMKILMEENFTHLDALVIENLGNVFEKLDQILNVSRDYHKQKLNVTLESGKSISGIKNYGYYIAGKDDKIEFIVGFMGTPTKLIYRLQSLIENKNLIKTLATKLNLDKNDNDIKWETSEDDSQIILEISKNVTEFMSEKNRHLDLMVKFIKDSIDEYYKIKNSVHNNV